MSASGGRRPVAFLSYVHVDDEAAEGRLTDLRVKLEREITVQTASDFTIFQDRHDIRWGDEWRSRIESSIDQVAFLIPILTPSFFRSMACRNELERFIARERELNRNDLIFPIYYIRAQVLEDHDSDDDALAHVLADRQYADWRDLRFDDSNSPKVARRIAALAQQMAAALARREPPERSAPSGGPRVAVRSGSPAVEPAVVAPISLSGIVGQAKDIGLVEVFASFDESQAEILREVRESRHIKIFVQMGKSVLSGAAIIYEALEHSRPDAEIQILHAGLQNPYLSKRVALNRNSDYREWEDDIGYAIRKARTLERSLGGRLELRKHSEGYVWRFFLFDDCAYLQPYLFPRQNAHRAPVLKFGRRRAASEEENARSLYHMFENYFDLKWDECAPEATRLVDIITPGETVSVAALVQRAGKRVYVVPKRFVEEPGEELRFHNIGGKRKGAENWEAALQREAMEEIGATLSIESSSSTNYLTTSAEFEPIILSDSPRPYCIYKRTRELDPEVVEREILWIIGYKAELAPNTPIEPRAEIAAIVLLSPNMLEQTADGGITYDQIRRAKDGSAIMLQDGVDFDYSRVAVPVGLAALPIFNPQAASHR